MIGFWLVNLIVPNDPSSFVIKTPAGKWSLLKSTNFDKLKPDIENGACGNTYSIEFNGLDNSMTSTDAAFEEMVPICLAASFLTGMAVTVRQSTAHSKMQIFQTGPHFPRDRGILGPNFCINNIDEFIEFVEKFVKNYLVLNATEKLRLMMHFFIDAQSCWSLENLYLSGSTILQIISSTEEDSGRGEAKKHAKTRGNDNPSFYDYLAGAAQKLSITPLQHDVIKIRNSLIHEGTLI